MRLRTKEAIEHSGLSARALQRAVKKGKIERHTVKKPGGGEWAEYDDFALDALRLRQSDTPTTAIERRSVGATSSNDKGLMRTGRQADASTALQRRGVASELSRLFADAIAAHNDKPRVEIKDRQFLTEREAAAIAGLTVAYIKSVIAGGRLRACQLPHVRGRRIARAELDAHLKRLELEGAGK